MQTTSGSLVERMIGAARLDDATYEEVEKDQNATSQAAIVVALAAVAAGIGAIGDDGATGLIGGIVGGLVGWAVGAFFIYIVGTRIIPATGTAADLGEVLRTLGFAQTPRLILVVGFIPVIGAIAALIAFVWGILTTLAAIRAALEVSSGRAIAIALLSILIQAIVFAIIATIFGIAIWGFS